MFFFEVLGMMELVETAELQPFLHRRTEWYLANRTAHRSSYTAAVLRQGGRTQGTAVFSFPGYLLCHMHKVGRRVASHLIQSSIFVETIHKLETNTNYDFFIVTEW